MASFRQYGNMNGIQNKIPVHQIYSAIYSAVSVYEMDVHGIAVMRRRKDSWLNATQILKVAGIEKGKRQKVLEKEILAGKHEKVQGGYGKYQGTWIPFDRGLEFCRQYGVDEILMPLLTHDMGQDGGPAGRGAIATPTKEQAMAAQRKRVFKSSIENRGSGQSGTFFQNISSTASNAVAAISKARFDSPVQRIRNQQQQQQQSQHMRPGFSSQLSMHYLDAQNSAFPGKPRQSFATGNSFAMNPDQYSQQPAFSQQSNVRNGDFHEPASKRLEPSPDVQSSQTNGLNGLYDVSMREAIPSEPNGSFMYPSQSQPQSQMMRQDDQPVVPLQPLVPTPGAATEGTKNLLMSLFLDASEGNFDNHEVFQKLSGEDLDMPIDTAAHTALHWAATLARLPLIRALIKHGASIYRVDAAGETALVRACVVTNNFDLESFGELLELLGPSIEMRDARGRTILHHIAITSAVKGRSQASKYYLDSLLEHIVRNGSAPKSQAASGSLNIARFMSEIVNAQDKAGNTALITAARIGNNSIISQLLEVGADGGIPNCAGLRPVDFGIGNSADAGDRHNMGFNNQDKIASKTKESSGEIITSISALLSGTEKEFSSEIMAKQTIIDSMHKQLRECSAQLGEERRRLDPLQRRAKERDERKQKITNLRKAAVGERHKLSQLQQQYGPSMNVEYRDVCLGDADNGISPVACNAIPLTTQDQTQSFSNLLYNPSHVQWLHSLPPTSALKARLNAYTANSQDLGYSVGALEAKSLQLEAKYRKIISICTGEEESKIDGLIDKLLRAVDSETADVELGRINEFLRKVEGVD